MNDDITLKLNKIKLEIKIFSQTQKQNIVDFINKIILITNKGPEPDGGHLLQLERNWFDSNWPPFY